MTIIAYAIQAFNLIKAAIEAGKALKDIYDIVERTNANLQKMQDENRGPTAEEWDALNAETENLRTQRPDITNEGE